ncbi:MULTISPECIES: HAD-IIA family hydrolase [Allobacillus]|uniref:Acid sugar phosphatase n=1 Tax=Allobacillus salarius TaxID=1955272 RepID=A0A556PMQ0_9BACI|nr:HAD-IIA family hydrolase [Allobacillus salarius]TSJ65628.1 HAD-IIA family hydrolase [Allobacillus salarius]
MQKGFIFDLDGTVYVDNNLIDGAAKTVQYLRDRGDKVVFLTNKSIETIDAYVEKLNGLGVEVEKENVINSNLLTAKYLSARLKSDEKVLVIGEKPLFEELQNQGIQVTEDDENVRYVVLGWDRQFNYEKLNHAFQAWRNGAEIVATNPDRTCPVEGGQIPDCGAMIGALEGATGETIEIILGKPNPFAAKLIVDEILQLPPENCYMIGDRLETDIRMGNSTGMQSVLVLTGITKQDMLDTASDQPKYVLNSISEIKEIIEDPKSKALDYQQK